MGSVSTFGAFTTARLGMYASMKGLSVTGNNIANINTYGYTRQSLDQISFRVGGGDRYASFNDARVGNGVLCTGISQMRDPYLDIRYRSEQSSVGSMQEKLEGLNDLASILDEVGKGKGDGVLERQFNDLVQQLQNLNTENAGQEEFDSLVRSSSSTLVKLFNKYSKELSELKANQDKGFRQDIKTVNSLLENIRNLNESIRSSEIHGDSALEARDERNLLIDKLSKYMKIEVTYEGESIGEGAEIQNLVIKLANGDHTTLVNGVYGSNISLRQEPTRNPDYDPAATPGQPGFGEFLDANGDPTNDQTLSPLIDSPNYDLDVGLLTNRNGSVMNNSAVVQLGDNDLYGSIQSARELLTEAGEFTTNAADPAAPTKRGIAYYQHSLDALAGKFASVMNEANSPYQTDTQGNYLTAQGGTILGADGNPLNAKNTLSAADKTTLENNGFRLGGPLFSNGGNGNGVTGITAANLSISNDWSTGAIHIQTSRIKDAPSSSNDNIAHIITQFDADFEYRPNETVGNAVNGGTRYFKGSFQEMLGNMGGILASDVNDTGTMLQNHNATAMEIDTSRDSVAGVDLNDEAANMMQYQKSYAAACRLMTTLDEALDKLINGTGVVGR